MQQERARQNLVRVWREKKVALGLTQSIAAARIGWRSQGTVSHYLHGTLGLSPDVVLKFARLLGVPPSDIDPESFGASTPADLIRPGILLPCGKVEPFESDFALSARWMARHGLSGHALAVFYVTERDLEPDYARGDAVLITLGAGGQAGPVTADGVWAMQYPGGVQLRRLSPRLDGRVMVAHHDLAPEIIDPQEASGTGFLLGRAVGQFTLV